MCSFGLSLRSGPRPADLGTTDHTCVSSLRTWGQNSPEANAVVGKVRGVGVAKANTAVARGAAPTAAAKHAVRARSRSSRVRVVTCTVSTIPVPAPLPYVARHIEDAKLVGGLPTHIMRCTATVGAVPRDGLAGSCI
jgi:hypothetical protein